MISSSLPLFVVATVFPAQVVLDSFGATLFEILVSDLAFGLFNLVTKLFTGLIKEFLFFPNPGGIGGVPELYDRMVWGFILIALLQMVVFTGTAVLFPMSTEADWYRFIERLAQAIVAVILGKEALTFLIEAVHTIGRFIFPNQFGLLIVADTVQEVAAAVGGAAIAYWVALVILYLIGAGTILIFLATLAIRALIVYTMFALFPIWMGLWLNDFGPMRYGYAVSVFVFRATAILLAFGFIIAGVLATGSAIATDTNAVSFASDPESTISPSWIGGPAAPDHSTGSLASGSRPRLFLKVMAVYGSLWAAVAISVSSFGLLVSVGNAAIAHSTARLQQAMPIGGGNTSSDPGGPVRSHSGWKSGPSGEGPLPSVGERPVSGIDPTPADLENPNWVPINQQGVGGVRQLGQRTREGAEWFQDRGMEGVLGVASERAKSVRHHAEIVKAYPGQAIKSNLHTALASGVNTARRFDRAAEALAGVGNRSIMDSVHDAKWWLRKHPVVTLDSSNTGWIRELREGQFVHVNGIAMDVGELEHLDDDRTRRQFTLVDGQDEIPVIFWGEQARRSFADGDLVTITGGRVKRGNFGLEISGGESTGVRVEPAEERIDRKLARFVDEPIPEGGSTVVDTVKLGDLPRGESSNVRLVGEVHMITEPGKDAIDGRSVRIARFFDGSDHADLIIRGDIANRDIQPGDALLLDGVDVSRTKESLEVHVVDGTTFRHARNGSEGFFRARG